MNINELIEKEEYKHFIPRPSDDDYQKTKRSIIEKGLIHSIVLNRNNIIIDGYTRYDIAKEIGMTDVPILIVDFKNEIDEKEFIISANVYRRQLTTAQKTEVGIKILEIEKLKAKERMLSGKKPDPTTAEGVGLSGEAMEIAAEKAGINEKTLVKAVKIKEFIEEHEDDGLGQELQSIWDEALDGNERISEVEREMEKLKEKYSIETEDFIVLEDFECPRSKIKLQILCTEKRKKYEDGNEEISHTHKLRELS